MSSPLCVLAWGDMGSVSLGHGTGHWGSRSRGLAVPGWILQGMGCSSSTMAGPGGSELWQHL